MIKINPTLAGFIKKEFLQTLRDPRNRMLLFIAPAIQMMVFGFAITSDIKNIRLAVAASHEDFMLNDVQRNALASGWFVAAKTPRLDPFESINNDEADAVLVPPPGGFSKSVINGTGEIQILINAMNVTKAQAVENYLKTIISTTIREDTKTLPALSPIAFDLRILYNPSMRSALFLVPAVLGMIVCLITILFTSMSITREKEQGTFETLISAPISPTEILLGKSIPFIILGIANLPLTLSAAVFILKIPIHGSIVTLLIGTTIFVCCTVSVGILISTICQTQQQSMMSGFLFLFPANLLSGLMFPVENMPPYMKLFAFINPLYYFNDFLRNIMLKGGEPTLVAKNILILAVTAIILMLLSYSRFRTKL